MGRPACQSPVPGVWYAGDWVGPEGHLADAAAASALSVVRGIAAEGEGRLRYAS
jgi:pyruvate/2-oxoglutarate dehydrogenase complex dihydrolipoamide dehydrogenase (E3) component